MTSKSRFIQDTNNDVKVDALSRRPELAPYPGDKAYNQQSQCLLTPDQVPIFTTYVLQDETLLADITMATTTDHFDQGRRSRAENVGSRREVGEDRI